MFVRWLAICLPLWGCQAVGLARPAWGQHQGTLIGVLDTSLADRVHRLAGDGVEVCTLRDTDTIADGTSLEARAIVADRASGLVGGPAGSPLHGRALKLREACVYVFDVRSETPTEGIWRERLANHGVPVVAVDGEIASLRESQGRFQQQRLAERLHVLMPRQAAEPRAARSFSHASSSPSSL